MLRNRKGSTIFHSFQVKSLVFLGLFCMVVLLCIKETPANIASKPALIFNLNADNSSEQVVTTNLGKNGNSSSRQNNEELVVDVVRDFGATGNGITDDTKAIQKAINTVYRQGGGVIIFPPGTYVVTSVTLKDDITYQGYGATIKRPVNQDKWTRTFDTNYKGNVNSKPLIVKGFTFDGNSQNQGQYKNYELEQAHLIFLNGDPKFAGKLQATIEDCTLKNGVADAISVYTNVDAKIKNIDVTDVFRGGFVLTGGNSSAEVSNLTTRGKVDPAGIDIEVDGRGYGNTLKVDVKFEQINLIDGNFDVSVSEDSRVVGNHIISDAPFYIFSQDSTIKFANSKFKIGATDGYSNRILLPHNVMFEDCEFYVTRKETGKPYDFFSAADVWWQHPDYPVQYHEELTFKNVQFKVDSNIQANDVTYGIYLRQDSRTQSNQLIMQKVAFAPEFTRTIVKEE